MPSGGDGVSRRRVGRLPACRLHGQPRDISAATDSGHRNATHAREPTLARGLTAACWYLWAAARGELTRYACGGFDGHGVAVPPAAIREVEIRPARRQPGSNGLT